MEFTIGQKVIVELGYKEIEGTVVKDNGKYITIKHDTFLGEVFKKDQVGSKC